MFVLSNMVSCSKYRLGQYLKKEGRKERSGSKGGGEKGREGKINKEQWKKP